MTEAAMDVDRARIREELGFQKWEAIGHFLGDADYLAFHQADYRGAIAMYESAWQLLSTPWQRETGGPNILRGIAKYALRAGDSELAGETLSNLSARASEVRNAELDATLDELRLLAASHHRPSPE